MRGWPWLGLAAIWACAPTEADPEAEVPDELAYCESVVAWDPAWSDFELEVVARVNLAREAGGMCGSDVFPPSSPLISHPSLRCAARVHALDMATRDYVMHVDPEGVGFLGRSSAAEFPGMALAENLATNIVDPESLVIAWLGSSDSCRALREPLATDVGVGFLVADEATFTEYWVLVSGTTSVIPR